MSLLLILLLTMSNLLGDSGRRVDIESVMIATVSRDVFRPSLSLTGTVIPSRTVYLDAIDGGRVEDVLIEPGNRVEQGDTLVRLSNATLLLDVINREAQLLEQRNNLRNSRLALDRNALSLQSELLNVELELTAAKREHRQQDALWKQGLTSEDAFRSAQDRFTTARRRRQLTLDAIAQDSIFRHEQLDALSASVTRIEANLELVQHNLDNLIVRAPISGLLTSLTAEVGESKSAGERIGQIDLVDDFRLAADVDEYHLDRIGIGMTGTGEIAGASFHVTLDKIYPEVSAGRFRVEFSVDSGTASEMRRGQTVHLTLQLGQGDQALLLSRGAFHQSTGGQWAFVLDADGERARRRPIRLGRQNQADFEVLGGLEEGAQVIVSSYQAFADANVILLTNN